MKKLLFLNIALLAIISNVQCANEATQTASIEQTPSGLQTLQLANDKVFIENFTERYVPSTFHAFFKMLPTNKKTELINLRNQDNQAFLNKLESMYHKFLEGQKMEEWLNENSSKYNISKDKLIYALSLYNEMMKQIATTIGSSKDDLTDIINSWQKLDLTLDLQFNAQVIDPSQYQCKDLPSCGVDPTQDQIELLRNSGNH